MKLRLLRHTVELLTIYKSCVILSSCPNMFVYISAIFFPLSRYRGTQSISLHFFFFITCTSSNNCSGLLFGENSEWLVLTKDADAAVMLSKVRVLCTGLQSSYAMCNQLVPAASRETFKVLLEVSLGRLAPVTNCH